MSREAYISTVEAKTGKTLSEFVGLAKDKGFVPDTKAGVVMTWLKEDFGLGHGHAMAMMHAIKAALK